MNPALRERIIAVAAAFMAVWFSVDLASGSLGWPMLAVTIAISAIAIRVTGMPLDALALAVLLFGYVVANRGFAQLMPIRGIPLLPAEIGLVIAGVALAVRSAFAKSLPWRRDVLNFLLLAWIALGTARFIFDFPRYGFFALRDFATIYYVAFFFIVQQLAADAPARQFLLRALLVTSVALPVVFGLFELFPEFFLGVFTFQGIPVVYFKGDLAPTFLGMSAVLLFIMPPLEHRWWARPVATLMVAWVVIGDNRASMLGLIIALGWTALSRHRAFAYTQGAVLGVALLILVGLASLGQNSWAERKLANLTDRAMSVVDLSGQFAHRSDQSSIKSDNNQFRWIWWRTVAAETMAQNPALGLGFGYDLARGFLQEYNPDMAEEFTARSPHSILVTGLGRLGLVGLALFAAFFVLLAVKTWRVMRNPASDATQVALWAALWPIAISSCLGVVLEGPMGAVVFWTLLGIAHAYSTYATAPADSAEPATPSLPLESASALRPALRYDR